ncbi:MULTISPECIES: hypothetical protein, partial [unclassified Bradyrhizobium]|uniref:hypothetical protein n=1 Tax=unclassified Bradyrhizobium TaxID=2631580 RepID=UPI0033993C59
RATSNRNGGRDHLGILGEIKSVHPGEIIGIRNRATALYKDICHCAMSAKFYAVWHTKGAVDELVQFYDGGPPQPIWVLK